MTFRRPARPAPPMTPTLFTELREAIRRHDEWPTLETGMNVIHAARRFVQAVDMRADVIEQMRRDVTPTQQALDELLGGAEK